MVQFFSSYLHLDNYSVELLWAQKLLFFSYRHKKMKKAKTSALRQHL